jgi:predicted  nucleic acid-binding Zn-ribbon protein
MKNFNTTKLIATAITFTAILFTQTVFAQKYKTAADTVNLNRAYGVVTLDISKLNSDLIEEQNKTPDFNAKSALTAQNAFSSAEYSKQTNSIAMNGNLDDAKTAMKQAKKANNQAKDARNAKNDQVNNLKKIDRINEKIAKKQAELVDLNGQKADIITKLPVFAPETI